MACQLQLAVWLVLAIWGGLTGSHCGAVGDEKHVIFECTALAPLRKQHANLFTP